MRSGFEVTPNRVRNRAKLPETTIRLKRFKVRGNSSSRNSGIQGANRESLEDIGIKGTENQSGARHAMCVIAIDPMAELDLPLES